MIICLLSFFLPTFSIQATDIIYQGIAYTLNDINKTATTKSGKTNSDDETTPGNNVSGAIVIPASVTYGSTTYTVTGIGASSFYENTGITSITLPNTITSIGKEAFAVCSGIKSIELPSSLTEIGAEAFFKSGLTEIMIPNSVTTINEYAFYWCNDLTSVKLSESLTSLEMGVFSSCPKLASIDIPASVRTIGLFAFSNCTSLKEVIFRGTITRITHWAFRLSDNIEKVVCYGNNLPTIAEYDAFPNYKATLYVQPSLIEKAQNSTYWSNFAEIKELSTLGLGDVMADKNDISLDISGLNIHVSGLAEGAVIQLYDLSGNLILTTSNHFFQAPHKGMFLLATPHKAISLLIK